MGENNFVEKFEVKGTFVGDRKKNCAKYVQRFSKFVLEREPDNAKDENAIKVGLPVKQGKYILELGYVAKEVAARIAPLMDSGLEFKATFRTKIINEKTGDFIALWLNMILVG